MSVEEWLSFHANPTIESLDASLIGLKFEPIHGCGCNSVKDVLLNHHHTISTYEYNIWFLLGGDDDVYEWNDHFKDLMICLVDRYPSVEPLPDGDDDELPMFIREFLAVRASAASGAISTLHALRKMVGKDAARIIGRVVWSERKNYHLNRPNKK